MTINYYDRNDAVRFSTYFTVSGSYADPTGVTFRLRHPTGLVSTYTYGAGQITKDSTGHYHIDVHLTGTGQYYYRFEGSGAVVAADETYLIVEPSEFD